MNAKECNIMMVLVLLVTGTAPLWAEDAKSLVKQGNEAYAQGDYLKAVTQYDQALTDDPKATVPLFNKANSYYHMDDLDEAIDLYREVDLKAKDMSLVEKARYNLGNSVYKQAMKQRDSNLQKAVDLYQGDLLAHDPYAEWAIQPRRHLREDFLNASLELASAYAYQGEFRRSVNLCRDCLSYDNSRESIYRALMLYLYCAGEQSEALQVYEEARQKLLEEIGVEPATQTKILLQQIQNQQVIGVDIEGEYPSHDDTQSAVFLLSQMPLVGRSQELDQLIAWQEKAVEPSVAYVKGLRNAHRGA